MEDVWTYLNQARLVIADITGENPNVFYELGIAHTLGKEVIIITQETMKPVPFDVGHVRYIRYSLTPEVKAFDLKLQDTINQVLKDSTVELRPVEGERSVMKAPKEKTSLVVMSSRQQRIACSMRSRISSVSSGSLKIALGIGSLILLCVLSERIETW
jgi:hypothetical protein